MRFQSRVVLASSVLGMFAASSGVALLMPERAEDAVVAVPEFAASTRTQAPPPAEPAGPAMQPVSGDQIVALALAPARDRAVTLIERAKAEAAAAAAAEQAREDDDEDDSSDRSRADEWRELRDEIREACDDGRIRGPICG